MRLEICPGFLVPFLLVPLVAVIVEQARVIHYCVYRVNDIFVGDRLPSIIREFLDLLNPLHQFLEQPVRVPQFRQLRAISDEVLVIHLPIICEEVHYSVPHLGMGKSPIAIEYSGKKCFADCLRDFLFPYTLEVNPLFEFPCRFRMVAVDVSRGDAVCPLWYDELARIEWDDEQGSRCHDRVDGGGL